MPRVIKFRAWQKHKQRMLSFEELQENGWSFTDLTFPDSQTVFMQFTGLLDKNGKEIYEGDLLRYSIQGDMQSEPMEVAIPDIFTELGHDDPYYHPDIHSFEVIGNIYTNPELIKQ